MSLSLRERVLAHSGGSGPETLSTSDGSTTGSTARETADFLPRFAIFGKHLQSRLVDRLKLLFLHWFKCFRHLKNPPFVDNGRDAPSRTKIRTD